ncbi:hypothetical protein HDU79_006014 [Rhizoclosmatium sp. JEL0117]|nr:hypothetical protein HDU79_006014 [Rhizoclosmatium sp. JEL0117]
MSIRLGLERILDLLKHLGNPQNDIKAVIHVAGTNGKGSVCALLSHALAATSIKVARFSSPHFITPTDSICINNTPIPDATYSNLMNRIKDVAESSMATDLPSSFEIECAIAFLWFSEQQVDVAVIEVGLGGRLDATNVFTNALCVFTALSIDHTEFLGSTIQEIATQKAGILHKPCSDCILGPQESFPESKAVIFAKAKEVGCQVWEVRDSCIPVAANIDASRSNLVKGRLLGQDIEIDLPLLGTFQYTNLATVLETLTVFYKHKYSTLFSVPPVSTLIRGLESTSWPGRMEWLAYTPPAVPAKKSIRFLADGAHNHQGAECLRAYLDAKYSGKSVHWVMGMKADREKMEGLVRVLVRGGDVVWSVGFEAPVGMPWIKSMPEDDVIKCVERIVPSVRECRVFKGGIREALDQLVDNERLIVLQQQVAQTMAAREVGVGTADDGLFDSLETFYSFGTAAPAATALDSQLASRVAAVALHEDGDADSGGAGIEGDLRFKPKDESRKVALSVLPSELITHIMRWSLVLDFASLVQLASTCRYFHYQTLSAGLWRWLCNKHYSRPSYTYESIALNIQLAERYRNCWLTMWCEKPRVSFDGLYVSRINYGRQGYAESHNNVFLNVTYYRFIRLFKDGSMLIWTTTLEAKEALRDLNEVMDFPNNQESLFGAFGGPVTSGVKVKGREAREKQQAIASLKGLIFGTWSIKDGILKIDTQDGINLFHYEFSFSSTRRAAHNKLNWVTFYNFKQKAPLDRTEILTQRKHFIFHRILSWKRVEF